MNKNVGLAAVIGAIVIALTITFNLNSTPKDTGSSGLSTTPAQVPVRASSDGLPGLLSTAGPWPNNTAQLADRLAAIGLPQSKGGNKAIKLRGYLEVIIEGKTLTIPSDIGKPADAAFNAPITTKDTSGITITTSATETKYYLGQLFDIWGVRLSSHCIGSYCTDGIKQLQVFSDGTEIITDPRKIELHDQQVIVITYGTTSQLPAHIRRAYIFPDTL